jgi:hypothetical protein
MKRFVQTSVLLVGLASLLPVSSAFGQAVYGSIYGTVTDASGAVVPGANVTVTDEEKGVSVKTQSNASGDYTVEHLIPDTYDVTVDFTGFKSYEQKGNKLFADNTLKIDSSSTENGPR